MDGYEEIQEQLEQVEQSEDEIIEKSKDMEAKVTMSASAAVAAISSVVRVGMSVMDVFDIAIDQTLKAIIDMLLTYAVQLALIAATMASNPVTAPLGITTATIAMTIQAKAIQLQATGASEGKEAMEKARRLMSNLTQTITIMSRF